MAIKKEGIAMTIWLKTVMKRSSQRPSFLADRTPTGIETRTARTKPMSVSTRVLTSFSPSMLFTGIR